MNGSVFAERLQRLRTAMEEASLDGFVVTGADSIHHLTGTSGGQHCLLVVTPEEAVLAARPTEYQQVVDETRGVQVALAEGTAGGERVAAGTLRCCRRVGFDPAALTFKTYAALRDHLPDETALSPQPALVAELRAIKEPEEVELIRQAAAMYDRALAQVIPDLEAGMTELEIHARLEYAARLSGADGFWFPSIVVSGPRTALPHGSATERRVGRGDLLVLDMGPMCGGYPSDATRTIAFAPVDAEVEEVYRVVLEAQVAALEACREGTRCSEVDRAARDVVQRAGFGHCFNHPVGHGVGGPPTVGPGAERPLAAGMVITIEPGVYIPGWGGVRIEDTVLVTAGGHEPLHRYRKDLITIGEGGCWRPETARSDR